MRSLLVPSLENYPETLVVNTTVVDSQMYFGSRDSPYILPRVVDTINLAQTLEQGRRTKYCKTLLQHNKYI